MFFEEIHHRKKSFIEEYLEFLEKFEIPYNERFIFNPVEYAEEDWIVPLGTEYG